MISVVVWVLGSATNRAPFEGPHDGQGRVTSDKSLKPRHQQLSVTLTEPAQHSEFSVSLLLIQKTSLKGLWSHWNGWNVSGGRTGDPGAAGRLKNRMQ